MTTPAQVKRALDAEARKFNKANRGVHVFDQFRPCALEHANCTASFHVIGASTPLDEMREALERVQARFPEVIWAR